jgi:hypothetical protein
MELWDNIQALRSLSHSLMWGAAIFASLAAGVTGVRYYIDRRIGELSAAAQTAREAKLHMVIDSALQRQEAAETEVVALRETMAPRRLDINQHQSMVTKLRQFHGQKLRVFLHAEPEPRVYGESIIKALEEAGWTLHVTRAINSISQPIYGLYVAGPHPESASAIQALISELVAAGNPVYSEGSNDADFHLSINLKPQPGVSITIPNRDPKLWHLPLGSNWTL